MMENNCEYLNGLNENQKQAVITTSQYVRVIAGAGSGKTRVLTTRILHLINNWGIAANSILAITFTNKAAKEMKDRLEKMLEGKNNSAHISTIHSFCVTFLRQEIKREGYPSNFTILDADDQKALVKEAIKQLNYDSSQFNIYSVLDYIANNKTAGFSAQEAINKSYNDLYLKMANIYEYYLNRTKELFALDFDDLLLFTNRILKKNPEVREKWQKKYNFILVDEFQDIDNVQFELITLLASSSNYIYVVGDPDQTIYSWRGANINIIMDFPRYFKGAETIILKENYRSTKNILNGANSLIGYNKNRVKKELVSNGVEGNKIIHYSASSEEGESSYVVDKIHSFIAKGYNYDDIAILYRNNYLSRSFEKQLIIDHIPYVIYGGVRFYERAEIKDMLSYLRMLTSKDDLALKRTINTPKRAIGVKSVDDLFDYSRSINKSLYEAIDSYSGSGASKMKKYKEMIEDFTTYSQNNNLISTFTYVYENSTYKQMLEDSKDEKDFERVENIKQLMDDINRYENDHPDCTLEDYLSEVALYTEAANQQDNNKVRLMTVHASKGLEFKNVFVVAFSDGIFPSQRSIEETGQQGLEEERRLAYVAFTRAKENLILTENRAFSYSVGQEKNPSRFIKEIDEQYIKNYPSSNVQSNYSYQRSESETTSKPARNGKYKKGELVTHDVFGDGIVVAIEGNYVQIAFSSNYGIKKIDSNFPKLHKKGS